MDNPLTPGTQSDLVEEALHTFPLATMPRDLTNDVMARIRTMPAPRPFRLTWSDFVLAVLFSLCLVALWFSVQSLPPIVLAQIRKESILFYQYLLVNARWLFPAVSFGLAGFLASLTIPYLRQELTDNSA